MHSCWSWFQDVTFLCVYVSVNRGRNLSVENRREDTRTRLLDMYGGSPVRLNYPNVHRKGAPYGLGKQRRSWNQDYVTRAHVVCFQCCVDWLEVRGSLCKLVRTPIANATDLLYISTVAFCSCDAGRFIGTSIEDVGFLNDSSWRIAIVIPGTNLHER